MQKIIYDYKRWLKLANRLFKEQNCKKYNFTKPMFFIPTCKNIPRSVKTLPKLVDRLFDS